ncbi:MAG: hypothetical protein QOE87_1534 [Gaiellales bacterium]|nr:hypothetical protein [Gaiellales bacterium]
MSRTRLATASLCEAHRSLERPRRDGLRERDLAVDGDDREVDAMEALELRVAVDRDAPQVESESQRLALEQLACARAEPAPGSFVEHDLDRVHNGADQPATVKPSWRSLVTSSLETASITSR